MSAEIHALVNWVSAHLGSHLILGPIVLPLLTAGLMLLLREEGLEVILMVLHVTGDGDHVVRQPVDGIGQHLLVFAEVQAVQV